MRTYRHRPGFRPWNTFGTEDDFFAPDWLEGAEATADYRAAVDADAYLEEPLDFSVPARDV
jgi:hypothetical protein